MKAQITRIGTVDEAGIKDWGFEGHGHTWEDFERTDGEQSYFGWSLAELREIRQAAQNCPLYKAGVLFR